MADERGLGGEAGQSDTGAGDGAQPERGDDIQEWPEWAQPDGAYRVTEADLDKHVQKSADRRAAAVAKVKAAKESGDLPIGPIGARSPKTTKRVIPPGKFEGVTFVGQLLKTDLRWNHRGDFKVSFLIPERWVEDALPLVQVVGGVPLSVHVEVFRPYEQERDKAS